MSGKKEDITMKSVMIKLDTINDVKNFVNTVSRYDFDVDLVSGRYAVDAKSIMGIFSLDLAKPIKMEIYSDDCPEFLSEIKSFAVEE
jgi:phosphocarrier protein HPr